MTWNDLRQAGIVKKEFATWSPTGKARAIPYKVDGIDETQITFVPRSGIPRDLPRAAAEVFLNQWESYKTGEIKREAFHDNNFNLSYLAGVLKTLEENN